MTDEEFVFHETNRERKRNGRGDYNKKRQGGKQVRLSTDHMSRREWEKLNGEVVNIAMDQPRTWKEYKSLPDDEIKASYWKYLNVKYDATPSMLAGMFGVSRNSVMLEKKRLGLNLPTIKGKPPQEVLDRWGEFISPTLPKIEMPEETKESFDPNYISKILYSLNSLRGSGAKLTIEITL